jgi:hypothetical protein
MVRVFHLSRRNPIVVVFYSVIYTLLLYLTTYLLLMQPRFPATDPLTWQETWNSSCRFCKKEQVPFTHSDFTLIVRTTCWANDVYWPIDWLRHRLLNPHHAPPPQRE